MKMLIMQEKENASNTPDVRRVAIKFMNQITEDKLISKQEAMCLTGGLSLFICSETIETVSLSGYKRLNTERCIFNNTNIDLYTKRENKCHHQYFHSWICEKKTRKTPGSKIVIPHFVSPNSFPVWPITEDYARYVLHVYKPWSGDFDKTLEAKSAIEEYKNS